MPWPSTETASRTRRTRSLYPRLEQLNFELMRKQTKQFDYVFVVGNGYRFRVCVMRNADGNFSATTQVGPRAMRHDSVSSPASAVQMLAIEIKAYIASRPERERHFLKEACSISN